MTVSIKKSDAEWRDKLTPEQYHVCRQCGTEAPFTGLYWDCHDAGIYRCVCCGSAVFDSESKFDSGSGWPSFWQATNEYAVKLVPDNNPRKGDADGFTKGTLAVSARELADRSVSPMPAASPHRSHGMERIEARCAKCDAHLGHLFEDGPPPTRLRFCINSTSLALDRK